MKSKPFLLVTRAMASVAHPCCVFPLALPSPRHQVEVVCGICHIAIKTQIWQYVCLHTLHPPVRMTKKDALQKSNRTSINALLKSFFYTEKQSRNTEYFQLLSSVVGRIPGGEGRSEPQIDRGLTLQVFRAGVHPCDKISGILDTSLSLIALYVNCLQCQQ